jgi:HAMP domain-containing protein
MSSPITLPVRETDGEVRLDRFLRRRFPHLTQGQLERLLRTGQIRLDGARARAADRVRAAETQLVIVTLLALAGAALLAWRIGRGVARPMSHLADTARRIAAGDLRAGNADASVAAGVSLTHSARKSSAFTITGTDVSRTVTGGLQQCSYC